MIVVLAKNNVFLNGACTDLNVCAINVLLNMLNMLNMFNYMTYIIIMIIHKSVVITRRVNIVGAQCNGTHAQHG